MQIEKVAALRDHMNQDGVLFCFSGFMTEDVLGGIAQALKKKMELENAAVSTSKGVFSIVVELSQNIIRYSAEHPHSSFESAESDLRYGVLAVGKEDGHYYVACGNIIRKEDGERLSEKLSHIQSLDRKALKTMYKEVLRGKTPEGSKGAGVGFIEIAMRATQGFEFGLQETSEGKIFFVLNAKI